MMTSAVWLDDGPREGPANMMVSRFVGKHSAICSQIGNQYRQRANNFNSTNKPNGINYCKF